MKKKGSGFRTMSVREYAFRKSAYLSIGMIPVWLGLFGLLTESTLWLVIITAVVVPLNLLDLFAQLLFAENWRGIIIDK